MALELGPEKSHSQITSSVKSPKFMLLPTRSRFKQLFQNWQGARKMPGAEVSQGSNMLLKSLVPARKHVETYFSINQTS